MSSNASHGIAHFLFSAFHMERFSALEMSERKTWQKGGELCGGDYKPRPALFPRTGS